MFIRRATIKSRRIGEPYYTYRLVESYRGAKGVRQHMIWMPDASDTLHTECSRIFRKLPSHATARLTSAPLR